MIRLPRNEFEWDADLVKAWKALTWKAEVNVFCSNHFKKRKRKRKRRKKLGDGIEQAPPPSPWLNLPCEITSMILQKVGSVDIVLSARKVCSTWRNICKDLAMWRVIDIVSDKVLKTRRPYFDLDIDRYLLKKLCRHAVNLSQGELIDIELDCEYQMLDYIAERSPKLRCLKIRGEYSDFEAAISSEAVEKLPLLEELHLNYYDIYDPSIQTIIDIGNWCPLLTTLSLNAPYGYTNYHLEAESNKLAFAISSIHRLRDLRMFASNMTNEGLTAILNGCTQLESLDIRRCRNLELDGKLGERCVKQIKHLRLPKDSIEDFLMIYSDYQDVCTETEDEEDAE